MDDETITTALGLEPVKHESVSVIVPEKTNNDIENDFKYTSEQGNHALEQMIDVARASEHPRAYEVVSTLMTTLVNANKDLLDLSKKKQELAPKESFGGPQTVNNNLFVGSTADLQKALKEL